jgi:hypothetical protein
MRQLPHDSNRDPVEEIARIGQRDARGRFVRANTAALQHGAHSVRQSRLLEPVRAEMRAAILSDLGHTEEDAPRALSIVVDQLVEARLIAQSYFEFLASSGGPITTKGRQRRAVQGWATASTHVAKLVQLVGVQRRARRTQTPIEYLESLPSTEQEETSDDQTPDATEQTGRLSQADSDAETTKPNMDPAADRTDRGAART